MNNITLQATEIQSVSFHNQSITILCYQNKPYVAMKPIVENIGLDWDSQKKRINRNKILNRTKVMMTSVAKDGKNRSVLCLPLSMLNGWLFGIETDRAKPEIRPKLEQYQLECYEVLFNHFMPKANNCLSPAHQRHIQKRVSELANVAGNSYQSVYSAIKDHFNVGTYKDIPEEKYSALCAFLCCEPLEGEYIANDQPKIEPVTVKVNKANLECLVHHARIARDILESNKIYDILDSLGNNTVSQAYQHLKHALFGASSLNVGVIN